MWKRGYAKYLENPEKPGTFINTLIKYIYYIIYIKRTETDLV